MIPKECKRLAEVDFRIAEVSRHAAREKSIRHGHPSTLHLWWARRPLASCRGVLLGLLWPDPCDPLCPETFKEAAREQPRKVPNCNPGTTDEDLRRALLRFIADFANWDLASKRTYLEVGRALVNAAYPEEPPLVVDPFAGGGSIPLEALRIGCEAFASDLNPVACLILKVMLEDIPRWGRKKVKVKRQNGEEAEADGLAEALRIVGKDIKDQAEKELKEFYPDDLDLPAPRRGKFFIYVLKCSDDSFYIGQTEDIPRRLKQHENGEISWTAKHLPVEVIHWEPFDSREAAVKREKDLKTEFGRKWLKREYKAGKLAARQAGGATPIAYLWARTVKCESPNCGAEIPLMRSFWLCKKASRKRALRYMVHHRDTESTEKKSTKHPPCPLCLRGEFPHVQFEIFEPKSDKEVPSGTVTRAKATCPCCGTVLPPDRVRAQLSEQRGGADVIFKEKGKSQKAKVEVERVGGARLLAVVTLKPGEQGRHYRLPTERDYQAVWKAQKRLEAILGKWERGGKKGFCPVPDEILPKERQKGNSGFRVILYGMSYWRDLFTARQNLAQVMLNYFNKDNHYLSLSLGKVLRHCNNISFWHKGSETVAGGFSDALTNLLDAVEHITAINDANGQAEMADATSHIMPDGSATVWFTDPPYYDAISYADLSDFFFVWLKRALPGNHLLRDPFDSSNPLTPKTREAIQDAARSSNGKIKDGKFYEDAMTGAFSEGRRILRHDGIGSVVFAHKTTEGWEALLSGMIRGGWTITGSWPIVTERGARLVARETAALATSVHLVCRPRPEDAPVGDWADVLRELPNRVGNWMERLQGEGIRGADLVFACIGPALEIFSRYRKVETADGSEVTLAEYLEKVWEVVGRIALENVLGTEEARARNGVAGALEEDARLTALFLWTLQSSNDHPHPDPLPEGEGEDVEDGEETVIGKSKGYSLVFDVARRFAQPLGIDLPKWEGRIIETKKGVVRLMAVSERAKQLFGEDGADAVADWIMEDPTRPVQGVLFPELEKDSPQRRRGRGGKKKIIIDEESLRSPRLRGEQTATTLDRVHAAMLLQSGGQANALRALIKAEQDRGPDFLRLANALSALYPKGSEEKRLLDAMLLAVPR